MSLISKILDILEVEVNRYFEHSPHELRELISSLNILGLLRLFKSIN
jgi:hypothetical protein